MKLVQHGSITHGRGWSRTCGQAALAALANTTIETAAEAIGHRHCTTYADIVRGFKALGIKHGARIRHAPQRRGTFLVRVAADPNLAHWIVLHEDLVYDNATGIFTRNQFLAKGWRMTSHMEIELSPSRESR